MSHEVLALAALSAHPALRDSHRNRALLMRLANRASKDGGGVRPSVRTLADAMAGGPPDPGDYRTRESRDRGVNAGLNQLKADGLLIDTGEWYGKPGEKVPVRRILIAALALYVNPIECGPWLLKAYPDLTFGTPHPGLNEESGVNATFTPEPEITPDEKFTPESHVHLTGEAHVHLTPECHVHPNQSLNQSLNQNTDQRAPASAPVAIAAAGDPEIEALNAATALRNQAALAKRRGAPIRAKAEPIAQPELLTPEPELVAEVPALEPRKITPGEARVAAAIETLLGEIGTDGQPERTLKLWRAKLRSRLEDDGVSEEFVAKRVETIRAAWENLRKSAWHVEQGRATRGHFYKITLRSGQELDAMALKRVNGAKARPWAAVGGGPAPQAGELTDADRAAIEEETEAMRQREAEAARMARAPMPAPVAVVPESPRQFFPIQDEATPANRLKLQEALGSLFSGRPQAQARIAPVGPGGREKVGPRHG